MRPLHIEGRGPPEVTRELTVDEHRHPRLYRPGPLAFRRDESRHRRHDEDPFRIAEKNALIAVERGDILCPLHPRTCQCGPGKSRHSDADRPTLKKATPCG